MNRDYYIKYKNENNMIQIMYVFLLEKGYKCKNRADTLTYLHLFSQRIGPSLMDYYMQCIVDYYDLKFNVTLVTEKKTTTIDGLDGTPINQDVFIILKSI